jgi:hypothetical protein
MATKTATLSRVGHQWIGEFVEDPGNPFRMEFNRVDHAEDPTTYYDSAPTVAVPTTLLSIAHYGYDRVVSVDI